MQITGGSIAVENGSNVITGTTVDWSQVLVGNYIIITGLLFEIAAIDLITNPTNPEITLTEDWPGADDPTLTNYVIQRDFSSQFRLPLLNAGDLEAAAIFTRAMLIIDGILGITGSTSNEITITQAGHDFIVGNCLRFDGTDWVRSSTASATAAIVVGMVSEVIDVNTVRIKTDGYVTGIAGGLTAGNIYYLKSTSSSPNITDNVSGQTPSFPGSIGTLRVPLFVASSTNSGYLLNLATAQTGQFGLNVPGIVPGPTSVAGTTFLRDDGTWQSTAVALDSLHLGHLKKPDPLSSWLGTVDWVNWFTNTGNLGIWAHMNDLHIRLGEVETTAGNVSYTRLVYTRKNHLFAAEMDATLPLTIPDDVNEIIVTLIGGYATTQGYAFIGNPPRTVITGLIPNVVYGMRLRIDTSVNKNFLVGLGVPPRVDVLQEPYNTGRALIVSVVGSVETVLGRVPASPHTIGVVSTGEIPITLAGPISGVLFAQTFLIYGADKLTSVYRSVERDVSVADYSWLTEYDNRWSNDPTLFSNLTDNAIAYSANAHKGHAGAVIIEYGAGAVFGGVP